MKTTDAMTAAGDVRAWHALDITFTEHGAPLDPDTDDGLARLLTVSALVNDASVEADGEALRWHGDPTEAALVVAALKAGLDPAAPCS